MANSNLHLQTHHVTISHVCLLDPPVVRDVLPLRVDPVEVEAGHVVLEPSVLVDDALGLADKCLLGGRFPPVLQVAVAVVLAALDKTI